jgi:Raf kinase inhibitor-like YbhB/YbcL family protein
MQLLSSAFKNEAPIPQIHTCEGKNQSPPLSFKDLPTNTKSLALIMEDPDAPRGTFVHWVVWNIDPKTSSLDANIIATAPKTLLEQGQNSGGSQGYMGPCPPSGKHRYFFKLFALNTKLNLENTTTKEKLLLAMKDHILGQTELFGTYQKTNKPK